jgi:multiple sugar transport system ATP-binding protein
MRPEHIDDAALTPQRGAQLRFRARVDLVESMGSELYLHFGAAAEPQTKEALMGDLPTDGAEKGMEQVIARVPVASRAAVGEEIDLCLDLERLKLFDPASGDSLLAAAGVSHASAAA